MAELFCGATLRHLPHLHPLHQVYNFRLPSPYFIHPLSLQIIVGFFSWVCFGCLFSDSCWCHMSGLHCRSTFKLEPPCWLLAACSIRWSVSIKRLILLGATQSLVIPCSCRLSALVWRHFLFCCPGRQRGCLIDRCVFLMTWRTAAWTNCHKATTLRMHRESGKHCAGRQNKIALVQV